MTAALLTFACVLGIATNQDVPQKCWTPDNEVVAAAIVAAHDRHPRVAVEVIAADIFHESNFRIHAIGRKREVGLMQVKRRGAVPKEMWRMTNEQLANPFTNVEIGVSYMEEQTKGCSLPAYYLTKYQRPKSGCRAGAYSRGVMGDLRRGRAALRQIKGSPGA